MNTHINYKQLREYFHSISTQRVLPTKSPYLALLLVVTAICLVLLVAGCAMAATSAEGIKDKDAILAIIGEAENQGGIGMLAVACAIRNRGTLEGVYGIKAKRMINHQYSIATYKLAASAWLSSQTYDITNGATHWENIRAFGRPYWVRDMVETYRYKDHVFYKQKGHKAK